MSRIGRALISSDDATGAVTLPSAPDILPASQGGFGQDVSAKTGVTVFYGGTAYFPDACVTPEMFGGGTSASAATNTTAFDAAIATGEPVFVPVGEYNLTALTKITSPVVLFGTGRGSKLIFNTTGTGIEIEDATPTQAETYHIHDLAFGNVTNTPASFILNRYPVNSKYERLYFSNCAATYCIDNESGYGTTIRDCVFSDVTGSGVRLRQNAGLTDYSYAFCLSENDFTRVSGTGIEIEGTLSGQIRGGVIESCGKGIYLNPLGATVQAWNVNILGTHFETNTADIDCNVNSSYWSTVTAIGITLAGTPTIALGAKGQLVLIGCQQGGGDVCTITGSADARVTLVGSNEANFTQSGTFRWLDLGLFYDGAGTPAWQATGTAPVVGDGTHTSRLAQLNNRVTYEMVLQIGSTSTMGTGNWVFGDTLLTAIPAASFREAAGVAFLADATGAYEVGVVHFADDDQLYIATASGLVSSTVPWTWAQNDEIRLSITYRT